MEMYIKLDPLYQQIEARYEELSEEKGLYDPAVNELEWVLTLIEDTPRENVIEV